MRASNVQSLQWAVGLLCTSLGALALIAPHRFTAPQTLLGQWLPAAGVLLLLTAAALLLVAMRQMSPRSSLLVHLGAGGLLLVLAGRAAACGTVFAFLPYALLGVATLAVPLVALKGRRTHRIAKASEPVDLFCFLAAALATLTGAFLLAGLRPHGHQPWAPDIMLAAALVAGGLLMLAVQSSSLRARLRPATVNAAHLACGAGLIAFAITMAFPQGRWANVASFGGIGLLVVLLPWRRRAAGVQPDSLRLRLALMLAVAAIIPVAVTMSLVSHHSQRSALRNAFSRQQTIASVLSQLIDGRISHHWAGLQEAAADGVLTMPPEDLERHLRTQAAMLPGALGLRVYHRDGTPRLPDPTDWPPPDLSSVQTREIRLRPATETLPAHILLVEPLPPAGTSPGGFLTAAVCMQSLPELLAQHATPAGASIHLVTRHGGMTIHCPGAHRHPVCSEPLANWDAMDALPTAGALLVNGGSERHLVGHDRPTELDAVVLVQCPEEVVLADVHFGQDLAFLIMLGFLGAAGLAGLLVAGRLTAPLEQLCTAVDALADERGDCPIPLSRTAEVNTLARSFARMRNRLAARTREQHLAQEALCRANQGLEARVSERTDELAHTNEALLRELVRHEETEAKLKELTATLEQRVHERSAVARRRARQLQDMALQLTQAEQRERRRLAQILHDHLQQLLVGGRFRVGILRGRAQDEDIKQIVQDIDDLLREAIASSRTLTFELSPPILYEEGLGAALRHLGQKMRDAHGLRVVVEADRAAEPAIEPVRVFLFQAARELLFNVSKHAQAGRARVVLRCSDDEQTEMIVSDNGKGFDVQRTLEREEGGGFGLFSIRERLEMLGGSFHAESSPGQGSRFVLSAPLGLPRELPEGVARSCGQPRSETPDSVPVQLGQYVSDSPRTRIVLADDHKVMREGLASLLGEEDDIEIVGQASDGRMAFQMAQRLRPDVVIMDVNMPIMDGIEATNLISRAQPEVAIIGLSMHHNREVAERMHQAGACDYVDKAGSADLLLEAIRRAAGKARAAAATAASNPADPSEAATN